MRRKMIYKILILTLVLNLTSAAENFPLTEEDFARAETINDEELVEQYPNHGGPLEPFLSTKETEDIRSLKGIWKNGRIPYTISGGFSNTDRAVIAKAMKYLEEKVCVRFEPAPNNFQLPRMDFKAENLGGFCYTTWRYNGGLASATVTLTPRSACTVTRTVLHEILHGFSWYHTHKRSDRNQYVKIQYNNIQSSRVDEFDVCSGCCCNTWNQPYDCSSVMHYAKDQMSKNGKDTIVAKNPRTCRLLPYKKWNSHKPYLSSNDISFLRDQYC